MQRKTSSKAFGDNNKERIINKMGQSARFEKNCCSGVVSIIKFVIITRFFIGIQIEVIKNRSNQYDSKIYEDCYPYNRCTIHHGNVRHMTNKRTTTHKKHDYKAHNKL